MTPGFSSHTRIISYLNKWKCRETKKRRQTLLTIVRLYFVRRTIHCTGGRRANGSGSALVDKALRGSIRIERPRGSANGQPLPSYLSYFAVRSELLACADLLHDSAPSKLNSIELSSSMARILQQKVDSTVTRVVLASKPTDMGMLADPGNELTPGYECRPKKRRREDNASASTAQRVSTGQHPVFATLNAAEV